MTFAELRAELFARGHDDMDDAGTGLTRAKRYLNQAYLWVCEQHPWNFLEATATGPAPLTIADVREVLSVTDTTLDRDLTPDDRRLLLRNHGDLSNTGTPASWYLEANVLQTYPVDANTQLSVRYLKVPAELSADGDTPVIPARFHDLVVDDAERRAWKAKQNYEAAGALQGTVDRGVFDMAQSLLSRGPHGRIAMVDGVW